MRAWAAVGPGLSRGFVRFFVCLVVLLFQTEAWAQDSLAQPFSEGFALQPLEPAPAGDRFFSVADGSVFQRSDKNHEASWLRLMLFGNYAYRPVLTRTDALTGERRDIVESQLYLHADVSATPLEWLLFNVDLPFAAVQESELDAANAPGPALGDLRLTARATVVGDDQSAFALGPALNVWLPTGSEENLTGDGHIRIGPKLNASGRIGWFVYTSSLGFLYRKQLDTGSLQVGPSLTFGAAAGILLFEDVLQVGPELYGRTLAISEADTEFESSTSPIGAILGARVRLGDFVIGAGYGPGVSNAPGSAPRIVASIALTPTTSLKADLKASAKLGGDGDNDGIIDEEDACPELPGFSQADPARHGCPEQDSDQDGIIDIEDACPEAFGKSSPNRADHGCPDRDGDTIADERDACPDEAGAVSETGRDNGCPERASASLDSDHDGVRDADDACPEAFGVESDDPNARGCPTKQSLKQDAGATTDAAVVTFAGFRSQPNGGASLHVELTRAVPVEVVRKNRRVEYVLHNATVPYDNNQNPLATQHFSSAVVGAQLLPDRKKKVVRLVIELRMPVEPEHHIIQHAGGAASVKIVFPPPSSKPRANSPSARP